MDSGEDSRENRVIKFCTNPVPILYQIYEKNADVWIEIQSERFYKSLNLGLRGDVERFTGTCILSPDAEVT